MKRISLRELNAKGQLILMSKKVSFIILISVLALFFASCSFDHELQENGAFRGYFVVTIDSVDYVVVYGGYGVSGICPKVK